MDFSEFSDIKLTGIDLDQESLKLAEQNIQQYNTSAQTEFLVRSAWELDISEEYDVIISNGLNIYEPDRSKLCELYIQLAKAIKPNGYLITSFLTPNPKMSEESPWRDFSTQDENKKQFLLIFWKLPGKHTEPNQKKYLCLKNLALKYKTSSMINKQCSQL